METYSSGNVVGMTGIHASTIRRYIRDFRSFFSESAQQPNRGRRYSADDIQIMLLIRHLYTEKQPKEKIISALLGEWSPPGLARYDIEDATKLVAGAKEMMRKASSQLYSAELNVSRAKRITKKFADKISGFEKDISEMNDKIDEINKVVTYWKRRL